MNNCIFYNVSIIIFNFKVKNFFIIYPSRLQTARCAADNPRYFSNASMDGSALPLSSNMAKWLRPGW